MRRLESLPAFLSFGPRSFRELFWSSPLLSGREVTMQRTVILPVAALLILLPALGCGKIAGAIALARLAKAYGGRRVERFTHRVGPASVIPAWER